MTGSRDAVACRTARTALLSGGDGAVHAASCPACSAFAARLGRVDATLAADADAARQARLPARLRARIVAAVRTAPAEPAPRLSASHGRLLHLFLRAAAVAAILAAAAWASPEPLLAEGPEFASLVPPELGLDVALAPHVERWTSRAADTAGEIPGGSAALAWAAAACLAAGWAAARCGRRA